MSILLLGSASQPLVATANNLAVYGSRTSPGVATSNITTVSVEGGVAPYTYSWAFLSGSSGLSATASTSATTAFQATLTVDQEKDAIFRCTVTDALGNHPTTPVDVSITLLENSFN